MRALLLIGACIAIAVNSKAPALPTRARSDVEALKLFVQRNPAGALAKVSAFVERTATLQNTRENHATLAAAKRLMAEAYIRLGMLPQAEISINEALKHARLAEKGVPVLGDVLTSKGNIYNIEGEYAEALTLYQDAFRAFVEAGYERGQAVALISISSLYSDARDNDAALRYSKQALETSTDDKSLKAAIHNSRGVILQDMGRYAESARELQQSINFIDYLVDPNYKAQIWANVARSRVKSGNLKLAEDAVAKGLRYARAAHSLEWRQLLIAIAAEVALKAGNRNLADEQIQVAFKGVNLAQTTLPYREAHDTAYRTYQVLGRSNDALAHLVALKRLDDEATKLATTTSTALMGARFDFANQELRIAKLRADELRREAAVQRAQAASERKIFAISGAATAVVIALLAFALVTVRRSRNKVSAANDDLAVTNAALGKALAAKTEFLATTSHEIRTPLNGILGMTEVMLADAALAPRIRDRLSVVHGAGTTMRALVDDILDVAKMETGNLTIESAPFDLAATLREVCILWRDQALAKGLAFTARLESAPRAMVGDSARVRQIVFNLLANALKFTAAGGIELAVDVSDDRGSIAIVVRDTGIGIAAEHQAAVFETFRQADTSTTRRFGGTGLGLSICRNLAEAMGGAIVIDSASGQGSAFTVTLPLKEVERDAPCAKVAAGATLLIVESNPIAQAMWRALLTPHAGDPVFVRSADDAVTMLRCGGIEQVLVDNLTSEDEIDLIASTARTSGAQVTLLWPTARADERQRLIAAGVDRVMVKPIKGLQLIEGIYGGRKGAVLESRAA